MNSTPLLADARVLDFHHHALDAVDDPARL
jgi:hypothetical protein